jgi:hypothetical protein
MFYRNTNATDVLYIVESANSVGSGTVWNGIATNSFGSWGGAVNVTENGIGSPVTVIVRDTAITSTTRFFRLRVTLP